MLKTPVPIVCFGEVLWDILPSGREPGGAPMNVTYHLHKHRVAPALITRIGNDKAGREIKELFESRGIGTDFFGIDEQYETGVVYARPDENNDMTYDIVHPVAWDFIRLTEPVASLAKQAEYFIYGSLAARSEVSRNSLLHLLDQTGIKVFDINLRAPHYSEQTLLPLLEKADILKMNEAELAITGKWFTDSSNPADQVQALGKALDISTIVITLGAKGAFLFMNGKFYEHKGYKVKVTDTIGSGDAFLAGLLTKLINNASPGEALEYAARLGAFIATQKGGCPEYELSNLDHFIE